MKPAFKLFEFNADDMLIDLTNRIVVLDDGRCFHWIVDSFGTPQLLERVA